MVAEKLGLQGPARWLYASGLENPMRKFSKLCPGREDLSASLVYTATCAGEEMPKPEALHALLTSCFSQTYAESLSYAYGT